MAADTIIAFTELELVSNTKTTRIMYCAKPTYKLCISSGIHFCTFAPKECLHGNGAGLSFVHANITHPQWNHGIKCAQMPRTCTATKTSFARMESIVFNSESVSDNPCLVWNYLQPCIWRTAEHVSNWRIQPWNLLQWTQIGCTDLVARSHSLLTPRRYIRNSCSHSPLHLCKAWRSAIEGPAYYQTPVAADQRSKGKPEHLTNRHYSPDSFQLTNSSASTLTRLAIANASCTQSFWRPVQQVVPNLFQKLLEQSHTAAKVWWHRISW